MKFAITILIMIAVLTTAYAEEVAFLNITGEAESITISGDYAYIAAGKTGLRIISIENPKNPVEVGYCNTPSHAYDVAISGDYAYVADSQSGMNIISIVDPEKPKNKGSLSLSEKGLTSCIVISGDYAYIGGYNLGLRIISIADPEDPKEVGKLLLDEWFTFHLDVLGDYAYVVASKDLYTISILDPKKPEVIRCDMSWSSMLDIKAFNNRLYIVCEENGLEIIDISDPNHLPEVKSLDITKGHNFDKLKSSNLSFDGGNSIEVVGNVAYVATKLGIKFVSTIEPPSELLSFSQGPTGHYYDIAVSKEHSYAVMQKGENSPRGLSIMKLK